MKLFLPEPSLVLLIGVSGSGKSTFARSHFMATEVLSSDHFRGLILDDETNQTANSDVFAALHFITAKRLNHRRLTVIDATSVQAEARKPLLTIAAQQQLPAIAIVFNLPEAICQQRNQQRARQVEAAVIHEQFLNLQESLAELPHETYQAIHMLATPAEIEAVQIRRQQ